MDLSEILEQIEVTKKHIAEADLTDPFVSKNFEKEINQKFKLISQVDISQKGELGQALNLLKQYFTQQLAESVKKTDKSSIISIDLTAPFDINTPIEKRPALTTNRGTIHPLNAELDYVLGIFRSMGFTAVDFRQLDDDYHMFESLNFPKGHPARDMWDTFWTDEGFVPPAHTSSMQNRLLRSHQPPIRYVVPGRCFRNEATDPSHEHTLHQVEGIYVDKGVSMGDMLGTIKAYIEAFFQTELNIKVQTAFFPFTEPSAEFTISCPFCKQAGCGVCGNKGWIELMGCGMIHPNVLKEAGIDSEIYFGFAWGFGLDRIVMIKNGIKEVRLMHSGDLNFLNQF